MSEIVPEEVASGVINTTESLKGDEPELIYWDRDSAVFHLAKQDKVLKVYTGDIDKEPTSFEKLTLYKETVNKASEMAKTEKWTIEVPGYNKKIPIEINRVDSLTWRDDYGCGVAISQYVTGPAANEVFFSTTIGSPKDDASEKDTYWWEKYPETNPIRNFLVSKGLIHPHKMRVSLYNFDEFLNEKLEMNGIFIGSNNIKVKFDPEDQEFPIRFIATDLCVDIGSLEKATTNK